MKNYPIDINHIFVIIILEMSEREPQRNGHSNSSENPLKNILGFTNNAEKLRRREIREAVFTQGLEAASSPNQTAEGFESWFNDNINSQETDPATKMRAIIGAHVAIRNGESQLSVADIKAIEDRYTSSLPLIRIN